MVLGVEIQFQNCALSNFEQCCLGRTLQDYLHVYRAEFVANASVAIYV